MVAVQVVISVQLHSHSMVQQPRTKPWCSSESQEPWGHVDEPIIRAASAQTSHEVCFYLLSSCYLTTWLKTGLLQGRGLNVSHWKGRSRFFVSIRASLVSPVFIIVELPPVRFVSASTLRRKTLVCVRTHKRRLLVFSSTTTLLERGKQMVRP